VTTPRILKKLVIGLVLVSLAAFAHAAERSGYPRVGGHEGTAGVAKRARFGVSGHVTGLYPGATKRLRLTLRNPNPFPITVKQVRTSVRSSIAGCPSKSIRVRPFKGSKRVGPRSKAKVKVAVTMSPTVPQACAGRRYRLTYRGKAIYR
jgi:hypothetical protein